MANKQKNSITVTAPANSLGVSDIQSVSNDVMPGLGGTIPNFLGQLQTEAKAGEAAPLLMWIGKHRRKIVWSFILFILATVGYGVWQWHVEKVELEAQIQLGKILILEDANDRLQKLEKYLAEAPKHMKPGVNLEIALTALSIKNYDKAAVAYKNVRLAVPNSAFGISAGLNEASILEKLGKPSEAVEIYNSLLASEVVTPLKNAISERKAFALETSGKYAEALEIYKNIPKGASENEVNYYHYKINQLTEKLKK